MSTAHFSRAVVDESKHGAPKVVNALKDTRGFSLIELVVVLFILGLVLSVMIPNYGQGGNLASSARQLVGMIRSLHVAASSTKQLHRLYLDLDQQAYWATVVDSDQERPPADPSRARHLRLPPRIRFRDAWTFHQGKVASGRAFVQFFPVGRAERTVIHLADEEQNVLTLVLNPATGVVQVLDRYVEPSGSQPVSVRLLQLVLPVRGSPLALSTSLGN